MSDVEQEIRELKLRLDALGSERARAEYERDAAKASAERARAALDEEFGVADMEQAKELLASLKLAVQQAVLDVRTSLDGAA